MPVRAPGSRLYRSIPFRHLGPAEQGAGRSTNIALNVTPFVDMMTILVTFLLMVFSSTGAMDIMKGLQLPDATNKDLIRQAPVIAITNQAILFNQEEVGSPIAIEQDTSPEWKITELFERLLRERQLFDKNLQDQPEIEQQRCECEKISSDLWYDPDKKDCVRGEPPPTEMCLNGLVILQADKSIKAKVINRVLRTTQKAEYRKIMFAINRKGPATP